MSAAKRRDGGREKSRGAKALTAKSVAAMNASRPLRREIPDAALPGFYLVVQPSGVRSWALRYRFAGRPRKLTLGPVIDQRKGEELGGPITLGQPMTLTEARRAARDALQTLAEGVDPGAAKKAARTGHAADEEASTDTVEMQGEQFVSRYCKPRNRSWQEVDRQFKREINPQWGDRKVQDIGKRDVLDLLDAIIDRGSPVTANRVFATLRRFFGWLVERDVIASSPCAGIKKPTPEKSRERILTSEEIRLFWKAAEGFEYPFGPMWRLMLLTGQRRNEVAGMKRDELSLEGRDPVWLIPAARSKNGSEHLVPLAPAAVDLIKSLPAIGRAGFVFTTTGESPVSGFSRSKQRLDTEMLAVLRKDALMAGDDPEKAELASWTLHDLRRTMASGMASLAIDLATIEKCLNHTSGSFGGIVGVYQRHDFKAEKRRAFEAWSNQVAEFVTGEPSNNVVSMRMAK